MHRSTPYIKIIRAFGCTQSNARNFIRVHFNRNDNCRQFNRVAGLSFEEV